MRPAKFLLAVGVLWMAGWILYGFTAGNIFSEAKILLRYPWFQISMADLYTGFLLFSAWVISRERSWVVCTAWIILFLTLGNLATCAYALIAIVRTRGDRQTFWLGSRIGKAAGDN